MCPTPRAVAHQAPLSMGFSRQEHRSGLPCPPPGHLPNPEVKPTSLNVSRIRRRVLDRWCHLCVWGRVCTRAAVLQCPPEGSRQPLVGSGELVGRAGRAQGGVGRPQQVRSWAGKSTQGPVSALANNTGPGTIQKTSRRKYKTRCPWGLPVRGLPVITKGPQPRGRPSAWAARLMLQGLAHCSSRWAQGCVLPACGWRALGRIVYGREKA